MTSAEWTPVETGLRRRRLRRHQARRSARPRGSRPSGGRRSGWRSSLRCTRRIGRRQVPFLERRPVPQCAGLARQNRDVVQRVVDCLVAAEGAIMPAHDLAVLPAFQPVRHRRGSRPAARPRGRPRSNGSCRSARGRSWRQRPGRHGSRRMGRHMARGSRALPRTLPRSSCPGCRGAGLPWHGPGSDPRARRSVRHRILNFGRGTKNRRRSTPTWFSTWPFSQPEAGVQATGSTR
jgi:hypothetical protein